MQTRTGEITTPKMLNSSMASTPNTLYASKILNKDIEIDCGYVSDNSYTASLTEMLGHQHPLIYTWLMISSVSIGILSALLFIIH